MSKLSEQILYSTVRLEGQTEKGTSVGTGLLFNHDNRLFVVTSKQVIQGVTTGTVALRKGELQEGQKTPVLGQQVLIEFKESNFVGHPSPGIDVAVMNISQLVNRKEESGTPVFWQNVTKENQATPKEVDKFISPIEEIVFVGYPSGIWDAKNILPVARRGITATPYYINFLGEPRFLIDAAVFPGSSGSPVFLYNAGSYADREGNLYTGGRLHFLGILSQVFHRTAEAEIQVKEVHAAKIPIAEVPQMINLGVVFNDTAVMECFKHYSLVATIKAAT